MSEFEVRVTVEYDFTVTASSAEEAEEFAKEAVEEGAERPTETHVEVFE